MGAAAVPIIAAVASTALTVANTRRTERRQDQNLAQQIRNRSKEQGKIDERVQKQLAEVEASRSDDERRASMNSYSTALRNNRASLESGLTPQVGSEAFRTTAAQRAGEVGTYADQQAGLMARLDAPIDQRRGEAVSTTRFGEDLDIARRFSQGNSYLDNLRYQRIRRSPWLDAAAAAVAGYGGGYTGGAGAGGSAMPGATVNSYGAGLSSGAGMAPFMFRSPGAY